MGLVSLQHQNVYQSWLLKTSKACFETMAILFLLLFSALILQTTAHCTVMSMQAAVGIILSDTSDITDMDLLLTYWSPLNINCILNDVYPYGVQPVTRSLSLLICSYVSSV